MKHYHHKTWFFMILLSIILSLASCSSDDSSSSSDKETTPKTIGYLSTDSNQLYSVVLSTGESTFIGKMDQTMTDIALDRNGQLWGITFNALYQINKSNAFIFLTQSNIGSSLNALAIRNGGVFFVANASEIFSASSSTSTFASLISLGIYSSVGNLGFDASNNLYMISSDGNLIRIDTTNSSIVFVGSTGLTNIYGLFFDS